MRIVYGSNFNNIRAHNLQSVEALDDLLDLTGRESAYLRSGKNPAGFSSLYNVRKKANLRARSRRHAGVNDVDIEGNIDWIVADDLADLLDDASPTDIYATVPMADQNSTRLIHGQHVLIAL